MDDEEKNQQDFDFNSSMTDLMTSLMVIFVLLLVVLFNNIGEKGQKIRDKMVSELTTQGVNDGVNSGVNIGENSDFNVGNTISAQNSLRDLKITKSLDDPLSFVVSIDEQSGLKFNSNSYEIMPQSKPKLKAMYEEMLDYVCKEENKKNIDSIQIIGYTDSKPVKADPKFGNLSLSQDRALSVLKFGLQTVGVDSDKSACLQELASINGRGMAELKATDEESRRVEFKIRIKSYEQDKFFGKF